MYHTQSFLVSGFIIFDQSSCFLMGSCGAKQRIILPVLGLYLHDWIFLQKGTAATKNLTKSSCAPFCLLSYLELSSCVCLRISEGKGEEPLPRSACQLFGPPDVITAYRFDSLTRRMADDDMFSSDLTENELREKLGHVNVPCLLAISADDEYVPSSVDSTLLSHRMADAMAVAPTKGAKSVILASGGHGIRNAEGQTQFISVSAVISRENKFLLQAYILLYNFFTSPNDNKKTTLYLSRVLNLQTNNLRCS